MAIWLDLAADIVTIAASLAVIVTTAFIWRQVGLQRQDVDTDIRRLQRESLSAIHETLQDERFLDARAAFFAGAHQREHSDMTDDEKKHARFILSVYTLLSRMVASRAIDETLYRDYWRGTLLRDWDRLENFVAGERLGSRNHQLYQSVESLVESWSRMDA